MQEQVGALNHVPHKLAKAKVLCERARSIIRHGRHRNPDQLSSNIQQAPQHQGAWSNLTMMNLEHSHSSIAVILQRTAVHIPQYIYRSTYPVQEILNSTASLLLILVNERS